jgi:hypothetical protein
MFTASGLQVRFLKIIEKSNYATVTCLHLFISDLRHVFDDSSGQMGEIHHQERRVPVQGISQRQRNTSTGYKSTTEKYQYMVWASTTPSPALIFRVFQASAFSKSNTV